VPEVCGGGKGNLRSGLSGRGIKIVMNLKTYDVFVGIQERIWGGALLSRVCYEMGPRSHVGDKCSCAGNLLGPKDKKKGRENLGKGFGGLGGEATLSRCSSELRSNVRFTKRRVIGGGAGGRKGKKTSVLGAVRWVIPVVDGFRLPVGKTGVSVRVTRGPEGGN